MEKEINEKDIIDEEVVDITEEQDTVEDSLQIAEDNMEILDTQIGKVKFSRRFYNVCAGIGGVSAGIGIVQFVLSAPIVPVVAAVGFGTAAVIFGTKMSKKECQKEDALIDEYNKNVDYARNVLAKRK